MDNHQLIRILDDNEAGMPNPITQADSQLAHLKNRLIENKLPIPPIHSLPS
ncbi:hypothetical protein [Halobacillus sp. Marseille-Q1614]|uniref:hypothetical protein n=1 Tax=Halobacillus sp. Marseille-Q1614 TaxID=2709134 RepID=UPI001570AC27|nr:hypothetical protein [Halobacillus sp. Marseille-Q1614]